MVDAKAGAGADAVAASSISGHTDVAIKASFWQSLQIHSKAVSTPAFVTQPQGAAQAKQVHFLEELAWYQPNAFESHVELHPLEHECEHSAAQVPQRLAISA